MTQYFEDMDSQQISRLGLPNSFPFSSSHANNPVAGPSNSNVTSSIPTNPVYHDNPTITTSQPVLGTNPTEGGQGITTQPSFGRGITPRRSVRPRITPNGGNRGVRGGRGSSFRSSTRLSARAEQASRVQKLKLNFKTSQNGGNTSARKTSFLGEYDRELDENPDEPLCFEEHFILRVPKEVADGNNGLREMVKGKGKGVENLEFKFLGQYLCLMESVRSVADGVLWGG